MSMEARPREQSSPEGPLVLPVDEAFLRRCLLELLDIPSPSGYTDRIVHYTCDLLTGMDVDFEITRRGAIRANLDGEQRSPDRAVISHVDTLGAQVKRLKENGRLELVPIGTWSARFAEGARVHVMTDTGPRRGTILPLKASGHVFNVEVDRQPVGWEHIELRVDEKVHSVADLLEAGFNVGDIVAIDPLPEISDNGYINSRHLDDKAGVAAMLAALKAVKEHEASLPVDCHFLFTISEEVGSGASAVLHGDVAEMVAVDNGTVAPGQNSSEYGVTIAMGDQTGPFDWHLTQRLLELASNHGIDHQRDVFRYYRCDSASAIEAGNDIRTGLLTFGIDASHGYERAHMSALFELAKLITIYVQSSPVIPRDRVNLGPVEGFPDQPT